MLCFPFFKENSEVSNRYPKSEINNKLQLLVMLNDTESKFSKNAPTT